MAESDQSRTRNQKTFLTANGFVASILFLGSELLTGIRTTWIGIPHCNFARKIIAPARLDHDANGEKVERAKKRATFNQTTRTRSGRETWKAFGKQPPCCSDRLYSAKYFDRRIGKSNRRERGGLFF